MIVFPRNTRRIGLLYTVPAKRSPREARTAARSPISRKLVILVIFMVFRGARPPKVRTSAAVAPARPPADPRVKKHYERGPLRSPKMGPK